MNNRCRRFASSASDYRQRGVVLFIALIALVVLSLAAIGFMRSVDTGALLSGNLAFNRASAAISDVGMEAARTQLMGVNGTFCAGNDCLWADQAGLGTANGYWAQWQTNFDYRTTDWANAFIVNIAGLSAAQQAALKGYDVRYVVHRMCQIPGDPVTSNCVVASATIFGGINRGSVDYSNTLSQDAQDIFVPYYRVTLRVTGPRNSIAYAQVWML